MITRWKWRQGWISRKNENQAHSCAKTDTKLMAGKQWTDWLSCENGDQVDFHFTIIARQWRPGWLAHKNRDSTDYRSKPRPILMWKRRPDLLSRKIETRPIMTLHLLYGNEDKADSRTKTETRMSLAGKLRLGWLSLYDYRTGIKNQANYWVMIIVQNGDQADYRFRIIAWKWRPGWSALQDWEESPAAFHGHNEDFLGLTKVLFWYNFFPIWSDSILKLRFSGADTSPIPQLWIEDIKPFLSQGIIWVFGLYSALYLEKYRVGIGLVIVYSTIPVKSLESFGKYSIWHVMEVNMISSEK